MGLCLLLQCGDLLIMLLKSLLRLVLVHHGLVEAVEKASGLAVRDVYVSIHGRRERPDGETWERTPPVSMEVDASLPNQRGQANIAPRSLPLEPLLAEQPALVVLGDPGAGKSTLLKQHAPSLADDRLGHLPILVPLNQYAQTLTTELRKASCS